MKICLVAKTSDPLTGGLGRHIFELGNRLEEKDYDVTLITPDIPEDMELKPKVLRVKKFTNHLFFDQYFSIPQIYKEIMSRKEFDIIHCHEMVLWAGILAKLTGKDAKLVYTIHGIPEKLASRKLPWIIKKYLNLEQKVFTRFADKIICVSKHTLNDVEKMYAPEPSNMVQIYNGVDIERFRPSEKFRQQILFVGRLTKIKGPDLVLDAFSNIASDYPNLTLIIVGRGKLKQALKNKARDAGLEDRIKFLECIDDSKLSNLYSESIFVMPSSYEGQGIVYVEALSSGAPVIACDKSAVPEMIENGYNGFLTPRTSSGIEGALRQLLNDGELRRDLRENGRSSAKKFAWREVIEDTTLVYKDLKSK